MSESTVVDETTEVEVEQTSTEYGYKPPFLKISAQYPVGNDDYEVVEVELNLADDEAVGEYEPGAAAVAKSWVLDLVRETIGSLRRPPAPASITLSGADAQALKEHAQRCGGQLVLIDRDLHVTDASLGHMGSDRKDGER